MKTLLVMATHFIDAAIISEYRKMKNTPNVDAVLAIDNTNLKIDFKSRVENRIFFDTSIKCFFFDSVLHEEMQLPYITFNGEKNFGGVMWHNGDYRFYYLRKFFPDYDYYWLLEYDVFCNAENYAGFLEKFKDNRADLIVKDFRAEKKQGGWVWTYGFDWIYKDVEIFGNLFPVVRLYARAVDFLYKRHLEHKEIFQNSADKDKRWIFCELFTPTELMNGGFSCENLAEENVNLSPIKYLNDERFFLKPDNHLYHPVKSVKAEFSKMQAQYNQLFLLYRKVFLTSLADKIISICAVKNLPFATRHDLFKEKFLLCLFLKANKKKILKLSTNAPA